MSCPVLPMVQYVVGAKNMFWGPCYGRAGGRRGGGKIMFGVSCGWWPHVVVGGPVAEEAIRPVAEEAIYHHYLMPSSLAISWL